MPAKFSVVGVEFGNCQALSFLRQLREPTSTNAEKLPMLQLFLHLQFLQDTCYHTELAGVLQKNT